MRQFDRYYSLIFNIEDKLTEDANTMIDGQKNKSKCIRTIFLDFVRVNGIVNNYTDIPEKERLERFFGCSAYSGKAANTSDLYKREDKCSFQFILSPHNYYPSGLSNDVLVMLYLQNNASICIRELFLDFVKANGIIENYADIPEKERLPRFFGHVERAVVPAKQPGRTMKILGTGISKFVSVMKGHIMYLLTLFIQHQTEKRSASRSDSNTVVKLT